MKKRPRKSMRAHPAYTLRRMVDDAYREIILDPGSVRSEALEVIAEEACRRLHQYERCAYPGNTHAVLERMGVVL